MALALAVLAANSVVIQTVATDNETLKQIVRTVTLLLVLSTLIKRNVFVPHWFAVLVLSSAILLVLRVNLDQLSIIFALSLAMLLCQISERRALRYAASAACGALLLIFAFLWFGLTVNQEIVVEQAGRVVRQRQAYGTNGVPFFYNIVAGAGMLTVLYAYNYWSRLRVALLMITVMAVSYRLFLTTDARGGFLTVLLFFTLLFIVPRLPIAAVYALTPVALTMVTVGLAYLGNDKIDLLLSFRLTYYRRFLDEVSWHDLILSSPVKATSYPVDNSYIHLAVGGGLVTFAAFAILFWRAVQSLTRAKRYGDVAFLVASAVYFASESLVVRVELVWVIYAWSLIIRHGAPSLVSSTKHWISQDTGRQLTTR